MTDLKETIYDIIKIPQLMGLATVTDDGKPWVRYVMGFGAEDLTIRFVTGLQSRKVEQIKNNPEVHVICGGSTLEETEYYVQISGTADITTDKEERHGIWNDHLKAYFSGPDDPNYCIGIVKPYRIEYYTMKEMAPQVWEAD
jgi:general stress protein 26